jgi:DNA-binding MarR family transcriptional regulator
MTTVSGSHSPNYLALLQLLQSADSLWNASRLFFARWNLSPSQFNILNLLHLEPKGLSQAELGRLLIMNRSNVTGLVDRLEGRGLLQRHEVPGDRGAYSVGLTPEGTKLLEEILPHYYEGAEAIWDGVPVERVETLTKDLERIAAQASKVAVEFSKSLL